MNHIKTFLFLLLLTTISACNNSASNPREAAEKLTGNPKWYINEIYANDAPVFKNGKLVEQFGSVSFERYMETVSFINDGSFSGYFVGDTKPMTLKWKTNDKNITIFSADPVAAKGGEWTIDPSDVSDNAFSMKTQSTAYNYPQMTRIELKFRKEK
ncbi:hypothetical protein L0657_13830 [Dyadobacter sp. CY345]|uniref:hypothetical protein n=1 Tax=Dyadobacter sp. CY345 TaxID=2909335 RepID=UPI001F173967|nr:hypothetical protein [Dyadobacter sp. CY345]MCF2445042.1 hypothetical protein [Dyadobacter sp. CY345]